VRRLAILFVVVACKKESSPPPEPPAPMPAPMPAPAVPKQAPAPPQAIDLLHAVPMRVAVSSVVANAAHSPFDLVDGDLATAWNAHTGDAKAWVAFRVPPSTHVERVRMTAGFTGKGPEGDYFPMNLRIRRVRVWHDGVALREVDLDPESRALQDVPIDANGGDYKLEVVTTTPGTRKDWREICVSELQVIGKPPPGMKAHDQLELVVGSLDGEPLSDPDLELSPLTTYASVEEFCAKAKAKPEPVCSRIAGNCRDKPALPACGDTVLTAPPALPLLLPKGWKWARWIGTSGSLNSSVQCHLAIGYSHGIAVLEDLDAGCGRLQSSYGDISERQPLATQDGWLTFVTTEGFETNYDNTRRLVAEKLRVCGSGEDGTPECTFPTDIGRVEHVEQASGGPGNDGLDVHDDIVWRFSYRIAGNTLWLTKNSGKPDADAAATLGRHRLKH
jgi:hypothetical protein